jgi:hypothetical protein
MALKFENELDKIIFDRVIEMARSERNKKVSLDVNDLIEAGHTVEDIQNSMNRIAKIDVRTVFEETKDIPNMTMQ